jgi:hypothetical protein
MPNVLKIIKEIGSKGTTIYKYSRRDIFSAPSNLKITYRSIPQSAIPERR